MEGLGGRPVEPQDHHYHRCNPDECAVAACKTNKATHKRKTMCTFPLSWRSVGAAVPDPKEVSSTTPKVGGECPSIHRGMHVVGRNRDPYSAWVRHEGDKQGEAAVIRTRRRQAVQLYVGNCAAAMNVHRSSLCTRDLAA